MQRRLTPLLVVWLSIATAAAAGQTEKAVQEKVAPSTTVAREIHRIIDNVKHTKYEHRTRVDEEAGSYELDCSGLACYLLKRVLPEHYRSIEFPKKQSRAKAKDFQAHFAAAPTDPRGKDGWQRIERMLDARPGDILAWRSYNPKTGSTGHVILIDSEPTAMPDGQVVVTIIDSTSSRHGSDTRAKGETGIGRGQMWFTVDAEGRPAGYRWSRASGKLRERPISIGRAVPMETKQKSEKKRQAKD